MVAVVLGGGVSLEVQVPEVLAGLLRTGQLDNCGDAESCSLAAVVGLCNNDSILSVLYAVV